MGLSYDGIICWGIHLALWLFAQNKACAKIKWDSANIYIAIFNPSIINKFQAETNQDNVFT